MPARLTRRRLLQLAGAGSAMLLAPRAALAARARKLAPALLKFRVANRGWIYRGDRDLFASISPGVPGRDTATISFHLNRPATLQLEAVQVSRRESVVRWTTTQTLRAGDHDVAWTPDVSTPVGSYVMRATVDSDDGLARRVYGAHRPLTPSRATSPVVRVVNVEAQFEQRSYLPGEVMGLTVLADSPTLSLSFLRLGAEDVATGRNDEFSGVQLGDPIAMDWQGKRSAPARIEIQSGAWETGLYGIRLQTDDGRVGFAPFILRPPKPGTVRQAIVLPTNTWQAYNFYDEDGDGWGDTWYAGGDPPVDLLRPFRDRGVPPNYRRYDLAFQRWLHRSHRQPEYLADDDLEAVASGDDLRALYDLVVFPGHSQYMTEHSYDVVERFRDLGGRLIFLSANNFFWKVEKSGQMMRRIELWRKLGRPESAMCGVQYRANDDGSHQGVFTIVNAEAVPWLFDKTGLATGSTFGEVVGGYGIEIDQTTPYSPEGTIVIANIPDLLGPGLTAEMSYYETPAGARVFSGGTLDFMTSVLTWPVSKMLDNLWRHMLSP